MTSNLDTRQTPDGEYSRTELFIMEFLAHGYTRERISTDLNISPSTVARYIRVVTERAGADSTVHAVAILVAQGRISVRGIHRETTARDTALNWLHIKIMSCLDWREFQELRAAYVAMTAPETETVGNIRG